MKKRTYKTKINPKIQSLATALGLKIKVGVNPEKIGINTAKYDGKELGIYFPSLGIIFIRDHSHFTPSEMDFVVLHEIGHAIISHYIKDEIDLKSHEISANAIAFGFCAAFNFPVSARVIRNSIAVSKQKSKIFKTVKVRS